MKGRMKARRSWSFFAAGPYFTHSLANVARLVYDSDGG